MSARPAPTSPVGGRRDRRPGRLPVARLNDRAGVQPRATAHAIHAAITLRLGVDEHAVAVEHDRRPADDSADRAQRGTLRCQLTGRLR